MQKLLLVILLAFAGCVAADSAGAQPLSSAWATFDARGVQQSGASGLADQAAGRALTIEDPVRIASVSKLVVALGVMRMVEAGQLDLDRDVSDYLGWQLRHPGFADRPITLRLLLSHRSSLTDNVDYVVPLGTNLRDVIAQPAAFDAEHAPGSFFRYSNLNFPIVASVMEHVSGERFDRLMARLVLEPLEIDACFNWSTCSDTAMARATVLYHPDGRVNRDDLQGRRPDCAVFAPEGSACDLSGYQPGSNGALFSPQGGLRISVRDLVTVGQLLLNEGMHDGRRFLRQSSMMWLSMPVWSFDGTNGETDQGFYCSYGLAVQFLPLEGRRDGCHDDLFGGGRVMMGHAGDAYGLRSGLWIDVERGTGIAFFATGNGADPPRGRTAYRAVEEELAARLPR